MDLLKYISVIVTSMFKFLIGPPVGYQLDLSFLESFLLTTLGMMAGVIVFTFLGRQIKIHIYDRFIRPKQLFTPRNRRIVRVWRKYGLLGIAFLTPIFLSPPGGTLIAVSFGEKRRRIFLYMFVSGAFWSFIEVALIYFFGNITQF